MKLFRILAALSLIIPLALFSCGKRIEKQKAPDKIQQAFKEKFPKATDVEWVMAPDSSWKAEFKMDRKKYSAKFKADGQWQETEYQIEVVELPDIIKENVDTMFDDYDILKAEVSETSRGKLYELNLKNRNTSVGAFFTEDGIYMDQEKENIKGDKDDNIPKKDETVTVPFTQ